MGILAPGSAHAGPSAQPPNDTSGNFLAQVSGGGELKPFGPKIWVCYKIEVVFHLQIDWGHLLFTQKVIFRLIKIKVVFHLQKIIEVIFQFSWTQVDFY